MRPIHETYVVEPPVKKTQEYYKALADKLKAKQKERIRAYNEKTSMCNLL
jgi:hypothetical protein